MSQAVAQIGRVLSTAGLGSAEALNPYPKAQSDRAFRLDADATGVPNGRLVHRKTGQIVRRHAGRKYGR